ncbi:MAG: TonB-dependent receptor [bacterium]
MRKNLFRACMPAVVLFFVFTPPALAGEKEQPSEKSIVLPEIVVTATRNQEKTARIPSQVTVITEEDIRQSPAQTVPDLLRDGAGIQVKDFTGSGRTTTVDLRGFGESGPLNNLVLVDGRRVDEIDMSGVDWTQIPLDRIERIEVIQGSCGVLYGDRAVGGVINIITKKGEGRPSFSLAGHYGSYQNHKETVGASGSSGPFSYYVNAGFQEMDGYRQNSFTRNKTTGLRLSLTFPERFSCDLTAGYKEDKYGLAGYLTQSDLQTYSRSGSRNPKNWASTDEYYFHLTPQGDFGDFGNLRVSLSYRDKKPDSHWIESDPNFNIVMSTHIERWGILPQYTLNTSFAGYTNTLTCGLDYYNDRLDDTLNDLEIRRDTAGYYALDTQAIIPDLLLATLGYRQEQARYRFTTAGPDDEADHDMEAFQTGLVLAYASNSKAFFSFGQSFRFPATDELYSAYSSPRLNKDLKPQKTRQYDLGIQHSFEDWLSLGADLFLIDTSQEIFFDPSEGFFGANTNYPKTLRYGSEVNAKALLGRKIKLSGSYTYLDSQLDSGPYKEREIPGVAKHKAHLGAHAALWRYFSLDVQGRWAGSQFGISDWKNEGEKQKSYATLDTLLRFSWRGFDAWAAVNNLFNEQYDEYTGYSTRLREMYYYPSPERNYMAGVSYKISL